MPGLTSSKTHDPMTPSTGAAVRLHRNAVRDRPESLSAFKWNACPPSPEYPVMSKLTFSRIEALFYSPLAVFEVSDFELLNRQLIAEAAAIRAQSQGITRSNLSGWHSETDFFLRTEPGCMALREHISAAVRETTLRLAPKFDFN